eukprot:Polyplicarium_translucidae@DN1921_c0_g2_i1.p1
MYLARGAAAPRLWRRVASRWVAVRYAQHSRALAPRQRRWISSGPPEVPRGRTSPEGGDSSDEENSNDFRGPRNRIIDGCLGAFAFAGIAFLIAANRGADQWESSSPRVSFQEFTSRFLAKGKVLRVEVVNQQKIRAVLLPSVRGAVSTSVMVDFGSPERLEERLEQVQLALGKTVLEFVPVRYTRDSSALDAARQIVPIAVLFSLVALLGRRAASNAQAALQQGVGSGESTLDRVIRMGKASPLGKADLKTSVRFDDVAGMKEAKFEVAEFVDFLKNPKKYRALGAHVPRGALLVGPPGTGKTLLAKAVAGEADVPFYSITGSDFIEVFVGIGPSRVRDLFARARKNAPAIVFIDEIDAVGRRRARGGFAGGANDERENTLNQLLVEIDGFASSGTEVVVLAGTNRGDILDPALTRPGRFDRSITIEVPDIEDRKEIFKIHLSPLKLAEGVNEDQLASRLAALTPGLSGADIQNICNEAAIGAARGDRPGVDWAEFESSVDRLLGGLRKASGILTAKTKETICFHEVGHAVVGWFLSHADPILKVSIVPRTSGALGYAQHLPEDLKVATKEELLDRMAVLLGGRASEELYLGSISSGASDDLDKATRLAYSLVSVFGMTDALGLVSYQQREEYGSPVNLHKPYSEATSRLIDEESRRIVAEEYERAKALLAARGEEVRSLTELLMRKETLGFNDIRRCIGERPFPLKPEYEAYVRADREGE